MAQRPDGGSDQGCKVDRVREKYDLRSLDDRVLRRRKNEDASLRDLESYINKWILKTAMEQAGMKVLDNEEENYHRLLTEDDVMEVAAEEARAELEREGVNVEAVLEDFVSYQTVRKHLNDCLDTSTSEEYQPDIGKAKNTFGDLKGRVKNVVSRTINRLRKYDMLAIGEPEVIVPIKLRCGDCGRTHDLYDFIDKRKCQCKEGEVSLRDPANESSPPTVDAATGETIEDGDGGTHSDGEDFTISAFSGDGGDN